MAKSFLQLGTWSSAVAMLLLGLGSFPAAVLAVDTQQIAVPALQASLRKNIAHARDWLDQADYKSLNQSAGSLSLLAAMLKAKSDDAPWQAAHDRIAAGVGELQAAAKSEDIAQSLAALGKIEKSAEAAAALEPTGQPQPAPRAPAVRPLMLILDSLYADAKIAILTGNVTAAKNQAFVLSELGPLVSNSRQTEEWRKLASDYQQAATAAAHSPETDPQTVRQLLRNISQRCEACHETRGR